MPVSVAPVVVVICVVLTVQLVPLPDAMYVPGLMLPPVSIIPTVGVPGLLTVVSVVVPAVIVPVNVVVAVVMLPELLEPTVAGTLAANVVEPTLAPV